ncbi:hypothetical protein HC341_00225 [Aquisalimonas sp. 2447]|uniref:uroporphyrinogen-III C-methyltransferase n=1 Tax=Aquisalimonas sp. 2447 TaxID=2740807 RepID=UPI00143242C1|nr:uroporphyrinogen-III C-methyltransferase [Aquisalimonas sp. 2447]QIT53781.1 hypothetical protein HC341_00225 [Aquisalimonas sp. 2447]
MTDPSRNNDKPDEPSTESTVDESTRPQAETAAAESDAVTPEGGQGNGGAPVPATGAADGGDGGNRRALTTATVALIVALLVLVAVAVGGWWLWDRLQALEDASDEYAERMEVAELREQLSSRDERLTGRVDNLSEEHASHVRSLARAEESMETIRESQRRADEQMDRIEELAAAHRDDWIHAEAAYLYGIARYRTRFHGDVDGALQALKEADRLLEELGGETVEQRQAVADAINALLDVRRPDREGMAGDLRGLIRAIDTWPLKQPERRVETGEVPRQREAELDSLEGWADAGVRAWEQFREAIGSLVVVRRDEAPPRLMAPEESHYLRENLRLKLLTARLALLDGETAIYRDSLADVEDWLERHFETDDDSVREALSTVRDLRDARLTADLPDLGEILPDHRAPARGATREDAE